MPVPLERPEGHAPPAVFVHGYSCSAWHWSEARNRLGNLTDVVLLSLPGHDDTPLPADRPLDIPACVAYVIREVEALGTPGARLIGHSLGGMVGMASVVERPELFGALVLVDSFPKLGAPEPFTRSYWRGSRPDLKSRIVRGMMEARRRLPSTLWESVVAFDGTPLLSRASVPVRGIYGDRGEVDHDSLKKSLLEFGLSSVSDLELHVMREAGHFVMLEQPEAFYDLLTHVLASLTAGEIAR